MLNELQVDRSGLGDATKHEDWMKQLWRAGPHVEPFVLKMIADLLACSPPIEALLILRDGLFGLACERRMADHRADARELAALGAIVGREADWRSPTLGLPRQA